MMGDVFRLFCRWCVLALVLVLTACGGGVSSEEHIARARQYIDSSDYKAATIELKNALQQDKESGEARWLLGKIYLDAGDILSAEKELQRAKKLGWSPDDVFPALAKALLAHGKYVQVRELPHAELNSSAQVSLLATKALSELAQGEILSAKSLVEKALFKEPESSEALLVSAQIFAIEGDVDGAVVTLERILVRNTQFDAAWSLLGDLRLRQQKLEEALLAYDKAVSANPNSYGALYKRALVSLQMQQFEAAQIDVNVLLRRAPQHPGANYVQGIIHFQAGHYAEATVSLSVAEPAFSQFPLVLFFLGSAQLAEGNLGQAGAQAERFYELAPNSVRGRKLLAVIRLQQGRFDTVEEILAPVLDASPDDADALNLAANALLREGRTDEGITLLSRVAQLQPDSPVAQVRLSAGMLMGGKGGDVAKHLETALVLDPEFQQADILLVLNYLQQKDYTAAIEAAEAYKRRNLVITTPYNLLGRVYLAAAQESKAKESFEKALTLDAGDPGANHNLAQLEVGNNNLVQARQYYKTVLEHHENFLHALIQLALLDAIEGDEASLVARLEQAIEAHPTALQPRLLLGRYNLGKGRPEQVAPLFSSLEEGQQKNPQVLQLRVRAQLASKDPEAAQYTLEQLTKSMPDSAAVHHMMAMAAWGAGDKDRARAELDKALELDEKFVPARVALAKLLLADSSLDQFRLQLKMLQSLAPKNPAVLLLLADDAMARSNTDAARMHYEEVLEVDPDNLVALNNLAWFIRVENPAKALDYAQRANSINPDSPDVLDTLAVVEYVNGDYEGARRTISQALKLAPDSPSLRYHSAMIVVALGDSGAALSVLVELMASGEDFPESGDARALLEELRN